MTNLLLTIGIVAVICGVLLTAFALVLVPKTNREEYQAPKSMVLFGGFGPLMDAAPTSKVTEGTSLNAGDALTIHVNIPSSKNIDFLVTNCSTTYLYYPNVTALNTNWTVPISSNYNLIFTSSNTFSSKDIEWQVTKQWSETSYKETQQNVALLPFEFAYLGLGLALSGLALSVYRISTKRRSGKSATSK